MNGYFKLIDQINVQMSIPMVRTSNGRPLTFHRTMKPGQKYKFEYPDDPRYMQSLRSATTRKKKTPELKQYLDRLGIEYREHVCKACRGAVVKYEFNPIEVVILDE